MTLWSIFWRTFAALASAFLLSFEGLDVLNGDVKANAILVGLGLLGAVVGAIGAVVWAKAGQPATTPMAKAVRAALEKLGGVLAMLAFNTTADLVADVKIVQTGIGAIVLAFAITYFGSQAPAPAPPQPAQP